MISLLPRAAQLQPELYCGNSTISGLSLLIGEALEAADSAVLRPRLQRFQT